MQFLEKLSEIRQNIKILNLSKHEEEGTILCQNQIIILYRFSQNIY